MKIQHAIFYLAVLMFASCYPPEEPLYRMRRFPMMAGNQWHYQRQISTYNFRPVLSGYIYPDTTITFSTDVNVLGQVTLGGTAVWKVQTVEQESGQSLAAYEFYQETTDSLKLLAYSGISAEVYPRQKSRSPVSYSYQGITFGSLTALSRYIQGYRQVSGTAIDTITYEEGPVVPFIFPLELFSAWNYRLPEYPPGWRIFKRVVGPDVLGVDHNLHPVYKIEWFWDTNHSGIWDPNMDGYDYLSTSGLLRRTFFIKNLVVMGPSSGDTLGFFDYKEDYLVQSMSVHVSQ